MLEDCLPFGVVDAGVVDSEVVEAVVVSSSSSSNQTPLDPYEFRFGI